MTKGRGVINFVMSQPLFGVNWQYLLTFLIYFQAFTVLLISQNLVRLLSVFSFINYLLPIVLH